MRRRRTLPCTILWILALISLLAFSCSQKETKKSSVDEFENAAKLVGLSFEFESGKKILFDTKIPFKIREESYLLDLQFTKGEGKLSGSFNILSEKDGS